MAVILACEVFWFGSSAIGFVFMHYAQGLEDRHFRKCESNAIVLGWNVNELDGARAKHPPNANDSCGRGKGSGDAMRFDRNE